jgi:hypothetical protein
VRRRRFKDEEKTPMRCFWRFFPLNTSKVVPEGAHGLWRGLPGYKMSLLDEHASCG